MTQQTPVQANLDFSDWAINTENSGFDAEELRTFLSTSMKAFIAHYEFHLGVKAIGRWLKPWRAANEKTFSMRMASRGAGTKTKKWSNRYFSPNTDLIMNSRHSGTDVFTIYWFDQRGGVTDEEKILMCANRDRPLKLGHKDLHEFFGAFIGRFWTFNEYYRPGSVPTFQLPPGLMLTWRWPKIARTGRDVDRIRAERMEHIHSNFRQAERMVRDIRYQRDASRQELMEALNTIVTHLNRDKQHMDVEPLKDDVEMLRSEVIKMTDAITELCTNLEKRIEKQGEDIKTKMEK